MQRTWRNHILTCPVPGSVLALFNGHVSPALVIQRRMKSDKIIRNELERM